MKRIVLNFDEFINENFSEDYSLVNSVVLNNQENTPNIEEYLAKIARLPNNKKYVTDSEEFNLSKIIANKNGIYYADPEEPSSPIFLYDFDNKFIEVVGTVETDYFNPLLDDIQEKDFFWVSDTWKFNVNEILKGLDDELE